jgi:hypothetical protein
LSGIKEQRLDERLDQSIDADVGGGHGKCVP